MEMTVLYDARSSVVLLKQKNEVTLLTQSAAQWMCMGKWPVYQMEGCYFSGFRKARDVRIFSGAALAPTAIPEKN